MAEYLTIIICDTTNNFKKYIIRLQQWNVNGYKIYNYLIFTERKNFIRLINSD